MGRQAGARSMYKAPVMRTLARACSMQEPRTSGAGAAHQPWAPSRVLPRSHQAHDNTYLSYSRNAIISTVAGGALVQHHKAEGKPPLAGAGLLLMGGMFMYVGSGLYVYQVFKLARPMRLGAGSVLFKVLNAVWPVALWSISLGCLLDEYPRWLLEGLRSVESHLPSVLHASLFFDPPALYPVCKLLQAHG